MTEEELKKELNEYSCANLKVHSYLDVGIFLHQWHFKAFIYRLMERHAKEKSMEVENDEKAITGFESRLIWNDDKTACFVPKEFSSVKISNPYVMVQTKAGDHIAICEYSDKEQAKIRLQELMTEIGEKLALPKQEDEQSKDKPIEVRGPRLVISNEKTGIIIHCYECPYNEDVRVLDYGYDYQCLLTGEPILSDAFGNDREGESHKIFPPTSCPFPCVVNVKGESNNAKICDSDDGR